MRGFSNLSALTGFFLINSVYGACPHQGEGLSKWSDPETWPNNQVPTPGMKLEINAPILLDTKTERLNGITLVEGGKLIFSPDHETSLTTDNVLIESGGEMWVGSEDCPFEAHTEIMLTGEFGDDLGHETFGLKFIGVQAGGLLEIHGEQNRLPFTRLASTLEKNSLDKVTIQVRDDVTSWKAGDEVIIASTDYDMRQAEKYIIESIPDAKTLVLIGQTLNTHYGKIWETIDMAAEVALLSRNIKIHGEVRGEPCTAYDVNTCKNDPMRYDLMGGHIMTLEGFKSSTINGAELYHMGQFDTLGRYPIHYHMALDTRRNGRRTTISGNAFHDTYSRCLTIHGAHHVLVENNVANNHFGHCYFLEDGGEKYNSFINNIGMGTKVHTLTPGDINPSTFWITSPLTEFIGNVAAGSHDRNGHGIWFLFPDEPVGPSKSKGFFAYMEAAATPHLEIRDNVAHSNGVIGFTFYRRLSPEHGIDVCLNYFPRSDPFDRYSWLVTVEINDITAFKNRQLNVMMRSGLITMNNLKVTDSLVGIELQRNMLDGYVRVKDSIIAGVSDNLGYEKVSGISVPQPWRADKFIGGVSLNAEGPTRLENITFLNFQHNQLREATAIFYLRDWFVQRNGASTWSKNLKFNYEESEGRYIYETHSEASMPSNQWFRRRTSISLRDLDGTLTGQAGVTVTKRDQLWTKGHGCQYKEGSNLDICQTKYAGTYIHPYDINPANGAFAFNKNSGVIMQNLYSRVGFYHKTKTPDMPQTLDSFDIVITNLNTTLHRDFERMYMTGLDTGDQVIAGICVPMGFAQTNKAETRLFSAEVGLKTASSLKALAESTDPSVNLFFDREKGVVYRRFWEQKTRKEHELSECIAPGNTSGECQTIAVLFSQGANVDYNDLNCLERFGFTNAYDSPYF